VLALGSVVLARPLCESFGDGSLIRVAGDGHSGLLYSPTRPCRGRASLFLHTHTHPCLPNPTCLMKARTGLTWILQVEVATAPVLTWISLHSTPAATPVRPPAMDEDGRAVFVRATQPPVAPTAAPEPAVHSDNVWIAACRPNGALRTASPPPAGEADSPPALALQVNSKRAMAT
jgi:hypothetical protein